MDIRPIKETDNLAIAAIIRASLTAEGLNIPGTAYFDQQLDSLFEFYHATANSKYWVLVDPSGIVRGGVGVGPFLGEVGELQKLYLAPEALGHGFGRLLLETALGYARTHYQHLYLETFSQLGAANHLYEKTGFVRLPQPLGDSGHNACDAWFLKDLQL